MLDSEKTIVVTARTSRLIEGKSLSAGIPMRVPLDWVDKYGYDAHLHFDFAPYADTMRSEIEGHPAFDFWCPLSAVDGYGRHALDIWRGLSTLGCEVSLRNNGRFVDDHFLPQDVISAYFSNLNKMPSKVGLAMSVPYDEQIWDHQSVIKIVITQFETDRIPEKHAEAVNRCDHLITTSTFQVPIWKKAGVRCPISVLTPGVDTEFFSYTQRSDTSTFKVLMLGALTARKNPMGAIRVFQHASQGDSSWRLVFKTRPVAGWDEVKFAAGQDPRITMISSNEPPEAIRNHYHQNDVLLWPSKGEGVGLPPLEAMSTGMELVISDNSGMSDYVDDRICYPIKMSGQERSWGNDGFSMEYVENYGSTGDWWVPDERHAVKQLRKCFDNWKNGKTKGKLASEYVRANHTLRAQAQSVLNVVQTYL